jgi:pimeloyl-ACP methyl ester carboxylesterase
VIRKGYVDTKGGQMHYRHSSGGSGIPLVMIHMTASSSAVFEPMMRELDGKFPIYAFDTVNYGESYRTDAEPSIRLIGDVLLEALAALKVDRFHTYGHHTGVNIAVDMSIRAPNRVASVIAHGPNYISMEANDYCMRNMAKPNPIHVKGGQFMFAWSRVKDNMGDAIWMETPHAAEILNRDTIDMLRAGENWHWAYRAVFSHDLIAAMKLAKCPMLLICGRREPTGASYAHHQQALKDLPHAQGFVLEEGAVYAPESHAAELAREVVRYIGGLKD